MHLIVPALVSVVEDTSIEIHVRVEGLKTLARLNQSLSFVEYASRIIHSILRVLDGASKSHHKRKNGNQLIARLLGLKLGGNGTPFAGNFSNKGLYAYSSGPLKGCAFFGRGGSESDMLEKPLNKAIMHRPLDFTSEECSEKIANILGLKLGCVGGYAFAGNYKTKGLYTYRDGEAYFGREDDKK